MIETQRQIIQWLNDPEISKLIIKHNPIDCFNDSSLRRIYEACYNNLTGGEPDRNFDMDLYLDILTEGEKYWFPCSEQRLIALVREQKKNIAKEYVRNQYLKLSDCTRDYDLKALTKAGEKVINNAAKAINEKEKSITDYLKEINEQGDDYGILTGFKFLDNNTKGLSEGHFWVIGAYTNVGKTTLSMQIAYNVARQEKTSLFISTEMTNIDLVRKLLWIDQQTENCGIENLPIKFIDKFTFYPDIERVIRANKCDVVFVDFLQNIQTEDKSEYDKISNISIKLQALALNLSVCIVATSQVSNEHAKSKSDMIGFKGSGTISAACDVGIEIRRQSQEEEKEILREGSLFVPATVSIKKNRFMPRNSTRIAYDTKVGIFYDEYFK